MKVVIAIVVFAFSLCTQAAPKAYLFSDSFFDGDHVSVDGKVISLQFWSGGYSGLPDAMSSNPESLEYAHRHLTDAKIGSTLIWAGLAGALIYGFSTAHTGHFDAGTYWGIFFAGLLPGVVFQRLAIINLLKAVNIYNGVSVPKTSGSLDFKFIPESSGGALALAFGF